MVYFILSKDDNLVKIGYSKQVETRLKQLIYKHKKPLEIYKVINGDLNVEKYFHEKFKGYNVIGEWFNASLLDLDDYFECYDDNILINSEPDPQRKETQIKYTDVKAFKEVLRHEAIRRNTSINRLIQDALRAYFKK